MKRVLKVSIPFLLAIAVIVSIGWYLMEYDPDFTRDMLVSQARIMEDQGNHTLATWFYKLAYQQSGNDEAVALELAEQYRSMGNYTKAEYTLSNAIADGGSVELYIALCNIYVQQDKLLDAVTMLDNVANPGIKAKLDALRPDAPTPNHEPGYFNQYISVSLSVPEGKIYLTTDGSYPSTKKTVYFTPIPLSAGETVIHTLTVGENGLVSPLSVLSYTVAGIIEEVTIDDPAIDRVIRQQLQVSSEHILYTNELWTVTRLDVPDDAQSLSDLSKLPFLQSLTVRDSKITDFSALASLSSLDELIVSNTVISDDALKTISSLPKLNALTLTQCSLSGISSLSSADGLTYLDLSRNTIQDLTALENMPRLTYLALSHNAVTDLTSIGKLSNLTTLDLSYNSISNITPLAGCTELSILDLSSNSITTLDALDQLTKLQALALAFNQLTNVDLIAANTALTTLDISNNSITDITALKTLTNLTYLNFSYNQVEKLPEFGMDSPLVTIKGSQNKLSSLDELAGLESLNYVIMDFNEDISSVNALAGCYALVEVSVYGTAVREVDALTDMNVIVKYTPI